MSGHRLWKHEKSRGCTGVGKHLKARQFVSDIPSNESALLVQSWFLCLALNHNSFRIKTVWLVKDRTLLIYSEVKVFGCFPIHYDIVKTKGYTLPYLTVEICSSVSSSKKSEKSELFHWNIFLFFERKGDKEKGSVIGGVFFPYSVCTY